MADLSLRGKIVRSEIYKKVNYGNMVWINTGYESSQSWAVLSKVTYNLLRYKRIIFSLTEQPLSSTFGPYPVNDVHTTCDYLGETFQVLIGILYTKFSHENDRKHFICLGNLNNNQWLIL